MAASSKHQVDVELAAGGIVWFNDGAEMRVGVVHRSKHRDWTLPKGKPEDQEGMEATARREAMEETGWQIVVGAFAGTFNYVKNDRPKIVLMWHMVRQSDPYEHPAPPDEIDAVVWLSPAEAMERLSHDVEREFVRRHCLGASPVSPNYERKRDPKFNRLFTSMQHVREQFQALIQRHASSAASWWAHSARNSLSSAETALEASNLDAGWSAVHDAERFMIFGLNDHELINRAVTLRSETNNKLKGWRVHSAAQLLVGIPLNDWVREADGLDSAQRVRLEQVVVELLSILNEHSNNTYHRMHLVEAQLQFLVKVCGGLLLGAVFLSWMVQDPESPFRLGPVLGVALAGALGGVVSAMFQLSRVGQAKIPEALLQGLITSGRPIIGASSALFVYTVLQSGIVNILDPEKVTLAAGLVLGFIAGVSEKFVLNTVSRVAGTQQDDQSSTPAFVQLEAPSPSGGQQLEAKKGEEKSSSADKKSKDVPRGRSK